MYIPKPYEMNDSSAVTQFIQANSFGLLISTVEELPFATHLSFFYDAKQNVLLAHVARANPQWRNLNGETVLAVFSGPHAYISPSWYEVPASVPTWDYVAVHVYGKCSVIDNDEELASLLEKMVKFYEPDSKLPQQSNENFYQNMMKAIVGFRIDISRVEGVAKLSQNKSQEVQQRVIANLDESDDVGSKVIARLMQEGQYRQKN